MSHFTVLVIGDDIDAALAPYQENNMGDCPAEYLKFNDVTDEHTTAYDKEEAKIKEEYPTLHAYITDYCGYKQDPETKRYGYWENPNAKWDWYVVGGRWSGMLLLKDGTAVDSALIGEIDFAGLKSSAEREGAEFFDRVMKILNGLPIPSWKAVREKHGENIEAARQEYHKLPSVVALSKDSDLQFSFVFDDPFEKLCGGDRAAYLNRCRARAFSTHAILKDGRWYERGQMGWWACVSNDKGFDKWLEEYGKLVEGLPPETRVTVVDCHI